MIKMTEEEIAKEEIAQLIKGIVICKNSGEYLVDLILDTQINPVMLSSFVGALSLFGEETMKKIEEISIKGLDVDMVMISKYNLILVAILDKESHKQNIREEAEMALDMFFSSYQEEIEGCIDVCKFDDFKQMLYFQVIDYFKKTKNAEEANKVGDFGFFTEAIRRLRENGGVEQNGVSH